MIKLYAVIELLSGYNDYFDSTSAVCNHESILGNEYSNIASVIGKKRVALNPYMLGEENTNRTLEQTLDYYVGSVFSNENGIFETAYTIYFETKTTTPISKFFISFDTYNNYHPHSIEVGYGNGSTPVYKEFFDDDSQFEVVLDGEYTTFRIIIKNWNVANKPLVVTGIYKDITITVDYTKMISASAEIVTKADFKMPSYGIVSSGGSLEFNDYNDEVSDYADNGLLKKGATVKIYIEDTLNKTQDIVGVYETDKWDYDVENKTVSVTLADGLQRMQDIQIAELPYYPRTGSSKTARQIYTDYLRHNAMASGYEVKLSNLYMGQFLILKPYVKTGTMWSAFQKFGEATKINFYINKNGELDYTHNE